MSSALGLVPLIGREPLVFESFGSGPLFIAAVNTLCDVVGGPVRLVVSATVPSAPQPVVPRPDARYVAVALSEVAELVRVAAHDRMPVLVHDPLCPLVPAAFLTDLLTRARGGWAVAAVLPVVDTIKSTRDGAIVGTVDRDTLRIVSSPVAVPANRLRRLPDLAAALMGHDALVRALRTTGEVELVAAPSACRRVEDRSALELLTAFDAVTRRLKER